MIAKILGVMSLAVVGCGGHALEAVELPPAEQALVAHWTFDEGSGSVVHDTSGNNRNGLLTGGEWTEGKFGGGAALQRS